jgi:hypothetical protein
MGFAQKRTIPTADTTDDPIAQALHQGVCKNTPAVATANAMIAASQMIAPIILVALSPMRLERSQERVDTPQSPKPRVGTRNRTCPMPWTPMMPPIRICQRLVDMRSCIAFPAGSARAK